MHCVNGHLVRDDNAANPDVVHVHRKCFEWYVLVPHVNGHLIPIPS